MATNQLVLVANPGSASRKYALFDGEKCLIKIHFEYIDGKLVYSCEQDDGGLADSCSANLNHLTFASSKVLSILQDKDLLQQREQIEIIALRVVAPSSFFQTDRLLNEKNIRKLAALEPRASLHIDAALQEARMLKQFFPEVKIIGISDSAFHKTMPEHARHYAISLEDADKLDIKRFGYQGLSVESAVHKLKHLDRLPERLIVCHLGSGASVTAIMSGKSLDTSMGFSPLEGLMMSTRSGDIDVTATQVLQDELKLNNKALQDYLSRSSGLLGVSGESADIRLLLKLEHEGNMRAKAALKMYVYRVQQAIGRMSVALGGIDSLVFTGTVAERSMVIRRRVIDRLTFLGLELDQNGNQEKIGQQNLAEISPATCPVRIYVIPSDECSIIAKHAFDFRHNN